MKRIYLYILAVILSEFCFSKLFAEEFPAREIRAVWLTTNWNLDWPSPGKTPENQKKELVKILDQLQQANFNTILLQVRVRGDVFYRSKIEPWSPFFQKNTATGAASAYDPLQFAIDECHKRGMECHAWFVTFPVGSPKQVRNHKKNSVVSRQPDICKLYNGEWYLDPGNPQTRTYVMSLVDELISNYNVDGIHFDYIRYPENATKFPDKDTHRKYGKGKKLKDWREDNINAMVTGIYDLVKRKKPWVQVSCSPLGRYRSLNPRKGTWAAYESVHQDAGRWMKEGKMDAIYPMLYYNEVLFNDYVEDWLSMSNGRFVVPGLGVYRLLPKEGNWPLKDIEKQLDCVNKGDAVGAAFYRAGNVLDDTKGVMTSLKTKYYKYPAKIPPMTWLSADIPDSPVNLQVYRNKEGYVTIEWQSSNPSEEQTYTVYEFNADDINTDDAKSIVMTGISGNKIYLNAPPSERAVYYTVTASNRYKNESMPTPSAYFLLSVMLEK